MSCPAQHRAARPSENQCALVLGKTILLPLLADFLHRYPQNQRRTSLTDDYADLISDGYDLAPAQRQPAPQCDRLIARTVGSQQMLTCAPPWYLVQHGTPQTPDDLAHHQCLHFLRRPRQTLAFSAKGKEIHLSGLRTFQYRQRRSPVGTRAVRIRHRPAAALSAQPPLDASSLKAFYPISNPNPCP